MSTLLAGQTNIRFPAGTRYTDCDAHPASYSSGNRGCYPPRIKLSGCEANNSFRCRVQEWMDLYFRSFIFLDGVHRYNFTVQILLQQKAMPCHANREGPGFSYRVTGKWLLLSDCYLVTVINPLNPELNPICYLLAVLGAHHFLHVSRIRVKSLTFRRLMSYIYGAPILDVSRSHTTTQHSR